jgi:hypothetical protein
VLSGWAVEEEIRLGKQELSTFIAL